MKKHFLNRIMVLTAFFIIAGGLITSCKDYDDDINNLKEELTEQEQNLKALSEKTETAIKGLETKIKALEAKDVELLKSINDNKKEIAENKAAIAKNIEDIAKNAGNISDNADNIADNASNIEDNKKEIAKNLEKIKANEEKIAKALVRIKANEDAISTLKTKVQALRSELDVIKTKDIPELKEAITTINQHLTDLDTFVEEQLKNNEQFEKNIADLQAGLAKAATKEELQKAIADFNAKMTKLDEKFDGLISTLREELNKKFEDIDNEFTAIEQDFTDQKADYEKQIGDLRTEYKNALKNYPTKQELQTELRAIRNSITTLAGRVATLETNSATKTELNDAIRELKEGVIKTIQQDVSKLKTDVKNADQKAENIAASFSQEIQERITSIEYIPEYHVNGIPAAPLTYLTYKKWENIGTDTEAQSVKHGFGKPIQTIIRFNMNPHSAAMNADETLDNVRVEWIKSSNVTKSAAAPMLVDPAAIPLKVAWHDISEDGILEVCLEPNNDFKDKGYGVKNKFYMFRVVLEQYIDNEQEFETPEADATIRSEYILLDNQNFKTLKLHSLNLSEDTGEDFVGLNDLIDPATKMIKETSVLLKRKYSLDSKTLDLNKYVDVREVSYNPSSGVAGAVKTGKPYCTIENLAKYGLSVQYKILRTTAPIAYTPYVETNIEPATLPNSPIKSKNKFAEYNTASITQRHILTPMEGDYYTAIGHCPVIQIALKKGDDIIDVRYFPIMYIDYGKIVEVQHEISNYDGSTSALPINIDFNNTVVKALHKNFHDEKIFQNSRNILSTYFIYGTKETGKYVYAPSLFTKNNYSTPSTTEGTMSITLDNATKNLKGTWTTNIPSTRDEIVKAIKNGEDHALIKVLNKLTPKYTQLFNTGYFWIEHVVRVNFKKVTLHNKAGYFSPYWKGELSATNKDKEFLINPALITDAVLGKPHFETCQIKGNILDGYQKSGSKVTNVAELASTTCKKVRFVFDLNNFKDSKGHHVDIEAVKNIVEIIENPGVQILRNKIDNKELAKLTAAGELQLYELPMFGKANSFGTESAKKLLAYDNVLPIKVEANLFGDLKYDIDHFQVRFIKPLDIKFTKSELPSFEDFVSNGCTINVADVVTVKEAFGSAPATIYENGVLNATLAPWYNVSIPTWDLANAKCNVKLKGSNYEISDEVNNSFSAVSAWFTLTMNSDKTELTFHNNHGVTLQKEIIIKIPVSVKSKWGYYEKDSSIMTVKAKLGKK